MTARVSDVEVMKKQVRKLAAGKVLGGGSADVCLELGRVGQAMVRIAGGYGPVGKSAQPAARDRLIWVLDGHAEVHGAAGEVTDIHAGESTLLAAGTAYCLVFPGLTIYLSVEAAAD